MACSSCGGSAPSYLPTTPLPSLPICQGAERCVEVIDTDCVAYTGEPLIYIDAQTNDRLTEILIKMNRALALVGTGMIDLRGSTSVQIIGTGALADPYYVRARLNPVTNNLLRSTTDGLTVLFDEPAIVRMLNQIKNTPALKTLFCSICDTIAPPADPCPAPTIDTVIGLPSPNFANKVLFQLGWTLPPQTGTGSNDLLSIFSRRARISESWNFDGARTQVSPDGEADNKIFNTIYEFYVRAECGLTQGEDSNILEGCFVDPLITSEVTTNQGHASVGVTINVQTLGDIDAYRVTLFDNNGGTVSSVVLPVSTNATVVQHTFTGLTPLTAYELAMAGRVETYEAVPFTLPVNTTAAPVSCLPVTGLVVTLT